MKYYYTMKTTMTNKLGEDPVADFRATYVKDNKMFGHFGNGLAVVVVEASTKPIIDKEFIAKNDVKELVGDQALVNIVDKRLLDYKFNVSIFNDQMNNYFLNNGSRGKL